MAGTDTAGPKASDHFNFRAPERFVGEQPKQKFARRLAALKMERDPYLQEWQDLSDYIIPRRGRYLVTDRNKPRRSGVIINNQATIAQRTLGAGMMSGLSSPARPWFKLTLDDQDLAENGRVKGWLDQVAKRMRAVMAKSNLYNGLHQVYQDLGTFGNGPIIIDQDYKKVIRASVFAPGEYCFGVGADGLVNTLYREYSETVLNCIHKYGNRCSRTVIDLYDRGALDVWVDLVMAIEPNMGQVEGMPGVKGMPYLVVTYEVGGDQDKVLDVKGYREWPGGAARWDIQTGDFYGSGCGITALGDAKALQLLERRKATMVEKLATPPMSAPAASKNLGLSHLPGGVSYYEPAAGAGGQAIRPSYEINPAAVTVVENSIVQHERRIDEAYFKPLFLMLAESDRREITAREVDEKHEEKMLQLGPVLERLHNELLNPVIDRVYAIMDRAGLFPPVPDELHNVPVKVEYISILAQAQRAIAVGSIERLVGFVGNLVGAKPEVLDKLDLDQAIDVYADAIGADASIVNDDDKVKANREARAQQEQGAQGLAAGSEAAKAAQVLSQAKTSEPNLLNQILNAGVGGVS